jgi:hypothetical protein
MKTLKRVSFSATVFLGAVFLAVLVSFLLTPRPALSQGTGTPITGYFWSDTIGWIDLNCSNSGVCGTTPFGLSIDSSGNITGDAWSDSIGWVSANPSDLSGCPQGSCTATVSNGVLSGWLRALSGNTSQSGGWDGFISLSGSNYGVTESGGRFSGYAWGDVNVGWVDTEYAQTTYGTCTPAYICSGNTIEYKNSSCQVSAVTTCTSPAFCSAGSNQCLYPVISPNPSGNLTGNLQVVPNLVNPGSTVSVYWNVSNAQSCTVTGTNGNSWSGLSSPSTGETSSPITTQTTYTLSCQAYGTSPNVVESQTVNLTPVYKEI